MTETAFEDLTPPSLEAQADAEAQTAIPDAPVKAKRAKKEKVVKVKEEAVEAPASRKSKLSALYPEDATLTVLVEGNPKKANSRAAAVFEFYRDAKTVGDFFAATAGVKTVDKEGNEKASPGNYGDITYDVGHGYIKIG